MKKSSKRDANKAALVQKTAEIMGVKSNYVYKVIAGKRTNEGVLTMYMELSEGTNKLLEAVKQLVPFEGHKPIELQVEYKTFTH